MTFVAGMTALASCSWFTKPNPPADITLVSGNALTVVAGKPISVPPVVQVLDADGAGIHGLTVNWVVTTGGGTLSVTSSKTDAGGFAEGGVWTLGKIAGTNTVSASVDGLTKSVTFLAIGVAGPPAQVFLNGGANQMTAAGTLVPIAPSIRVTDANGNAVPGTPVAFSVTAGGG